MDDIVYVVKEGNRIQHDKVTYEAGQTIPGLTAEQAKGLHVETAEQAKARAVLAGKASYGSSEADTPTPNTKMLVAKIKDAKSIETVKALMSLSITKTVEAAGKKRLEQIAKDKKDSPPTKDELMTKIAEASTADAVNDLDDAILGSGVTDDQLRELFEAQSARKTELEG